MSADAPCSNRSRLSGQDLYIDCTCGHDEVASGPPALQIMHVLVVLEYSLEWLFVIHLATGDRLSHRDGLGQWAAGGGAQLAG